MAEYTHLHRDFREGEEVYLYQGPTYGCISHNGVACSVDGNLPFFELPKNAVIIME